MNPHVRMLECWQVFRSVCHFLQGREVSIVNSYKYILKTQGTFATVLPTYVHSRRFLIQIYHSLFENHFFNQPSSYFNFFVISTFRALVLDMLSEFVVGDEYRRSMTQALQTTTRLTQLHKCKSCKQSYEPSCSSIAATTIIITGCHELYYLDEAGSEIGRSSSKQRSEH